MLHLKNIGINLKTNSSNSDLRSERMQMIKIIGLGEYAVSSCEEDIIKTYALGSCLGLVLYNPKEKILGMVHIVLPDHQEDQDQILGLRQGYFAESAVPLLFKKVFGGYPDEKTLYQISLYGGASSNNKKDIFFVGERNLAKVEQILCENSIYYDKRNTGGHFSRTIEAYVKTGNVLVHTQEMKI